MRLRGRLRSVTSTPFASSTPSTFNCRRAITTRMRQRPREKDATSHRSHCSAQRVKRKIYQCATSATQRRAQIMWHAADSRTERAAQGHGHGVHSYDGGADQRARDHHRRDANHAAKQQNDEEH
jgi:hypothetical protein